MRKTAIRLVGVIIAVVCAVLTLLTWHDVALRSIYGIATVAGFVLISTAERLDDQHGR